MSDPEVPLEFALWYAKKFNLPTYNGEYLTVDKKIFELIKSLKIKSPKTYRFFVDKFKEENPNASLYYVVRINENHGDSQIAHHINVSISKEQFYSENDIHYFTIK